jgi:hypothetical protein
MKTLLGVQPAEFHSFLRLNSPPLPIDWLWWYWYTLQFIGERTKILAGSPHSGPGHKLHVKQLFPCYARTPTPPAMPDPHLIRSPMPRAVPGPSSTLDPCPTMILAPQAPLLSGLAGPQISVGKLETYYTRIPAHWPGNQLCVRQPYPLPCWDPHPLGMARSQLYRIGR